MASPQPPTDEKKSDHINIKVVDSDQNEIYFKIKKTTPLRKLMDTYCEKQGKQPNTVRFNFDGMRLNANQTPEQVGLENDDTIDVLVEQTGGFIPLYY